MVESDHRLERAIELLKEPVAIGPALDQRIMAEIESGPATQPRYGMAARMWDWMTLGRPIRLSPLGGLAVAAGFAALVLAGQAWLAPEAPSPTTTAYVAAAPSVAQFVFVAPRASTVSLVGDFNDWNASATPMQRAEGNGVWSITIPLTPGRYRYAFLIDGTTWLGDPSAPPAVDDDFGRPGSVVTIGEL